MDFAQLIELLRNPGEDGTPDSIYDDLGASYTEATSTRDAKISTSESRVAELELELLVAKSANWDLLQQIPVAESEDSGNDDESTENESEENSEDDPESDFFEKD